MLHEGPRHGRTELTEQANQESCGAPSNVAHQRRVGCVSAPGETIAEELLPQVARTWTAHAQSGWIRRAVLLALFAVAFGYVEAAVVVYLRVIYDPVRAALHPEKPPGSLLPLMTVEELRAVDPLHVQRLDIELGRELATMVMLVTTARLAARRHGEWLAMFMIAFGVWDAAYYGGLKAMIGFPESLLSWDILFLLPVPWLGPVLAPLIVSLSMIAAGSVILAETERGRPFHPSWVHWAGVVLGGLIIIVSFCKDYARTTVGEMPGSFNWIIFAAGEAVGLLAFGHAAVQARRSIRPPRRSQIPRCTTI